MRQSNVLCWAHVEGVVISIKFCDNSCHIDVWLDFFINVEQCHLLVIINVFCVEHEYNALEGYCQHICSCLCQCLQLLNALELLF